ncbi:MAG: potassium channel family protein [Gemmataceae bacterium]
MSKPNEKSSPDWKRVAIVAAAIAFTVFRYCVTLGTTFDETHDVRHADVLGQKIVLYLVISLGLFWYFAGRTEPSRSDLLAFLLFAFLIASVLTLAYTDVYKTFGLIDTANGATTRNTLDCYYFSIVTWTTLGYGDFRPTPAGRLFAASEAFVGLTFMGVFISVLVYLFNKIGYRETAREEGKR